MMQRRGFSLSECVALVAVVGLLLAILLPMFGGVRMSMRGQSSAEKLMSIGQGGMMYAADNKGRLFSYSWRAGEMYTMPDGRPKQPVSDQDAAALQNQEILMRRTGRVTGQFKIQNFTARLPHRPARVDHPCGRGLGHRRRPGPRAGRAGPGRGGDLEQGPRRDEREA